MDRRKRFQLIVSLSAALICFSITSRVYPSLLARERPPTPLDTLHLGEHFVNFFSRGQCFGALRFELSQGDNFELQGNARLLASFSGEARPFQVKLNSTFNSLGQLGGLLIQVTSGKDSLAFGLSDINPIRVRMTQRMNEKVWRFNTEIPGPVELLKNVDDTFRIQYRGKLPGAPTSFSATDRQPLLQFLQLEGKEVASESEVCSDDKMSPIELDQLAIALASLQRLLGSTIPQ
ncbi:MAG: hypothetical protein KDD64_11650 [Bdellovibrionales bacterium]|nr:hypothetical protein [Bdellovibrionales bacterium]